MEQQHRKLTVSPPDRRESQMRPYHSTVGGLGVVAFSTGDDHISVRMHTGQTLCFTHGSAGRTYVEHMKLLAYAGEGLNRFIFNEAKGRHEPPVAP